MLDGGQIPIPDLNEKKVLKKLEKIKEGRLA
jgi:hypothetical protein